jgi:hypothetical protein
VLHHLKDVGRPALAIAAWGALYGASASLDSFLRLFLRQDSGESFFPAFSRNFEFFGAFLTAAGYGLLGAALAAAIAAGAARLRGRKFAEIFEALPRAFVTLLVPVGLSLAGVVSLSLAPSYPYGLGLVLSLGLEGVFASLLTLGLLAACLVHCLSQVLGPGEEAPMAWPRGLFPVVILAAALLAFTAATPREFYQDGAGQGNMFKYLRMAAAVAGSGTLDIERANENPDPTFASFLSTVPEIGRRYVAESRELFSRILDSARRGEIYVGEPNASRANRSMFRSADDGIFYINAPGPGLLLVPAYLVDRFLNRTFGTELQVAAIVCWQLLGALLVYQTVLAASDLAGRAAAVVAAFAMALVVPVLFYTFQIYPELPAALLLVFAFRKLVLDPLPSSLGVLLAAVALAALPWLHQKYSVVSAVLAVYAVTRFARRQGRGFVVEGKSLVLLLLPLAISAYSIFLYNHALTGSLSPTATFEAADRSSFAPGSFPRGLLGLLFDRENGILVFAPFYLLALVGASDFAERHRPIVSPLALVVFAYLFVIGSFPYWPGAVSTMGRYILSILPLLVLLIARVAKRSFDDGVLAGASMALVSLSLAVSASFVKDLIPSYQPFLLWDRVLYSDPEQYLPNFLSEGFLGSGPAHFPKLLSQLLLVAFLVYALRDRVRAESRSNHFPAQASLGAALVLASICGLGALLQHFPGNAAKTPKPVFRDARALGDGRVVAVDGAHGYEGEGVWIEGSGRTRFTLLSRTSLHELGLSFVNGPEENRIEMNERGGYRTTLELPGRGPHERTVLLRKPYRFDGPGGERFLYVFIIRSRGSFVPAESDGGEDRRRLGTYVTVR